MTSQIPDNGSVELDTIMRTAETLVQNIMQYVRAGRYDADAQAAFTNWISEALLAQPTTQQIDQLCRAAGFAGPVDPATMKQRVDDLHATNSGLRREWSACAARYAVLCEAAQIIIACWEQGDLAQAVRRVAALLPKPTGVSDEAATQQ